ncbi:hypothetical protein HWV62_39770 [Athelia sp. TMB]|nr:hypothetical protein HWV62_39770 [Athelia sp. TMB]
MESPNAQNSSASELQESEQQASNLVNSADASVSLAVAQSTECSDIPSSANKRTTHLSAQPEPAPEDRDHSMGIEQYSLAQQRPRRQNRLLPIRFRVPLPQALPPAVTASEPINEDLANESICPEADPTPPTNPIQRIQRHFTTPRNIFGLFRRYFLYHLPTHDPEQNINLQDLIDSPAVGDISLSALLTNASSSESSFAGPSFLPYPNESSFRLGDWYWHGAQKSQESFAQLIKIITADSFKKEDVRNVAWGKINSALSTDGEVENDFEWLDEVAGWTCTPISIAVPFHQRSENPGTKAYIAGNLYHRSIVKVIKEKLSNPQHAEGFHYEPFELFWQPNTQKSNVRVYGELYTSPAFMQEHQMVLDAPGEPNCYLPRAIAALMMWSDATQLTSFGNAKLEIFHAQWEILLDDEFIQAYQHGIVVVCPDGISRRFYPRIFTYSADYPEKVLIASIRDKGHCPCPRCLIPLSRVDRLGTVRDMKERKTLSRSDNQVKQQKVMDARHLIYQQHVAVDNEAVEKLLKDESLVPTNNAFSKRLSRFGFNIFQALVVDIMHEFELGVWRAIFIHLIRILEAYDKSSVAEMDRRFRLIPTFGRDTIRRFTANVSELKKLAARDYEDILQCSIAVFDGLLPEPHNTAILKFLFTCAHWHALAKLRLHTDLTLEKMDSTTVRLGRELRAFSKNTCTAFVTKELKRETIARQKRQLRATKAGSSKRGQKRAPATTNDPQAATLDGPLLKTFNLKTIKIHFLGDHADAIRMFGTNDSHSTEPGELEHRTPIARYPRTSRRKDFVRQLANIDQRVTRLRRIRERNSQTKMAPENCATTPEQHHHIALSENLPVHIGTFLSRGAGDPAIKVRAWPAPVLSRNLHLLFCIKNFRSKLIEHFLMRFTSGISLGGGDSPRVLIKGENIYLHSLCRINYTSYDVRREQDIINASSSHCNIMVLGEDDSKKITYRYGRLLGTFHANVIFVGQGMVDYTSIRMEFLWIRWYEPIGPSCMDWKAQKLDRLRFPPLADEASFGFIDPDDVLRGCHLLPVFSRGRRHPDGKGMSMLAKDGSDWKEYYVNRFVDRDIFMRYYLGLGVGHTYHFPHHDSTDIASAMELVGSEEPSDMPVEEQDVQEEASPMERVDHEGQDSSASEDNSDDNANDVESEDDIDESDDDEFAARCEMYFETS